MVERRERERERERERGGRGRENAGCVWALHVAGAVDDAACTCIGDGFIIAPSRCEGGLSLWRVLFVFLFCLVGVRFGMELGYR